MFLCFVASSLILLGVAESFFPLQSGRTANVISCDLGFLIVLLKIVIRFWALTQIIINPDNFSNMLAIKKFKIEKTPYLQYIRVFRKLDF
jgi:hypothetical protein